jgi:HEAT repeat protein
MADRLVAIRNLLTHERQDRRAAAAIVLAELRVDDARTVEALLQSLGDEEPLVRGYALEALDQVRAPQAVDRYVELMDDPDPQVRRVAEAAVMHLGEDAVPALQALMDGPVATRRKAASMLARLQSAAGIESLIDAVDGVDATILDRARTTLRGRTGELGAQDVRSLRKRIEQRLNDARRTTDHALSASLLQLLGDLADETVVTRIVQEIGPETPAAVRRVALGALGATLLQSRGRRREAAMEKLLDCLGEEDDDGVIRPALLALRDVEVPARLAPRLRELLDAPSPLARAYVLTQLGKVGSTDAAGTLVQQLVQGSPPIRVAAHDALAGMPEAAPALGRALLDTSDPTRLREIGELLRGHGDTLSEPEARKLCVEAIARSLDTSTDVRVLIECMARAVPGAFMAEVRERVAGLTSAGRLDDALGLLSLAEESPAFGEEERYRLAVLGLRLLPDAGRPLRVSDRACAQFSELLRTGFPVESRLRQEQELQLGKLFQLGFAYSESRDEEERDFGHDLLEEVASRDPDGKLGARAQNKLKLTRR